METNTCTELVPYQNTEGVPPGNEVAMVSTGESTENNDQQLLFNPATGLAISMEQMIKNCTFIFFLSENKKIPVRRSHLIKEGMNGQFKLFNEVMAKLTESLDKELGIRIVGLEKKAKGSGFASYILLSKFKSDVAEENVTIRAEGAQAKRGLLFVILCTTFMLAKGVDEETIWKMITKLEFEGFGCPSRKDDLPKFIKQEYLITHYLVAEEVNVGECTNTLYNWGLRADLEVSKYSCLKYVASTHGRRPQEYEYQYNLIKDDEREKAEIEADLAKEAAEDAAIAAITGEGQTESETESEEGEAGAGAGAEDDDAEYLGQAAVIFGNILRERDQNRMRAEERAIEGEENEENVEVDEDSD